MTAAATSPRFAAGAEEAARVRRAAIPGARPGGIIRLPPGGPGPEGAVPLAGFAIGDAGRLAVNGGPQPGVTAGVSPVATRAGQGEPGRAWDALLAGGGKPMSRGRLQDRFGAAWQVAPEALPCLTASGDAAQVPAGMVRIGAAVLEAASNTP